MIPDVSRGDERKGYVFDVRSGWIHVWRFFGQPEAYIAHSLTYNLPTGEVWLRRGRTTAASRVHGTPHLLSSEECVRFWNRVLEKLNRIPFNLSSHGYVICSFCKPRKVWKPSPGSQAPFDHLKTHIRGVHGLIFGQQGSGYLTTHTSGRIVDVISSLAAGRLLYL